MTETTRAARELARVLLAGRWSADALIARVASATGKSKHRRWIHNLVEGVMARFGARPPSPRFPLLARFLVDDDKTRRAINRLILPFCDSDSDDVLWPIDVSGLSTPEMDPAIGIPGTDRLPALVTPGALARWLGLTPGELDWFADCHRRERFLSAGALRHYTYRWIAKPRGRRRLLESPKHRLKAIQRQILDHILSAIPPHPAAHAFTPGRSTLSCALPHAGRRIVLRIDLRDFFPTIRCSRVQALFHTIGYPEAVARLLTGLCTNSVPDEILDEPDSPAESARLREAFAVPHLPQGTPTSPALANLCAYRLDCRLAALAAKVGGAYTRYADDLVFSGNSDFERRLNRFRVLVCAILLDEGFAIRRRKTRVMRSGTQQQVVGLVVNARPNLDRREYDALKAQLFNCGRLGSASQNRESLPRFREHLQGRIAYVRMANPGRAVRLQRLFDAIDWVDVPKSS